jgi:hypothetical protein
MGLTRMKYEFLPSFHRRPTFFDKNRWLTPLGFEPKIDIFSKPLKIYVQHQNVLSKQNMGLIGL